MKIVKYILFILLLFTGGAFCGKLKFKAFKGPHFGFAAVKIRTPKLFGFKHHGLGFGHGHGGFGGGGFHSSGYEHHEYHQSHHSGGKFGGGGWFGK